MRSLYRKLLEVEIRHDYFLLPGPVEKYPAGYDISSVMDIAPSAQASKLMRDHKMVFRRTATGFIIYIQAEFISTAIGFASLVDIDPGISLSFYWSLKDNRFINFTNHRLREEEKRIYYFSNRSASQVGSITYLNKAIPAFGTTYPGEALYHLGDIVSEAGETHEMIEKEAPVIGFPGVPPKWQRINTSVVNYVNPGDRLRWQFPRFHHARPNTSPGEFITYKLLDSDAQPVDLGFIQGTGRPQNEYRTSLISSEAVDHTMDLSHLNPGKYSMEINELGAVTHQSFYLQDPVIIPDMFAVSEFFVTGAALPFQFITENTVLNRWVLDDPNKKFLVRFRNRLTLWKYLNQDQTLFHQAPAPRPLTQTYSGYQIAVPGGTLNLPDPGIDPIHPDPEPVTKLIRNIYSQIFLTK
jgi:hypothetical protein